VKPLLQVTNTEEKINQKEAELKQVVDRFDKLRVDHEDLEKQHKQVLEEKSLLAEQLQAEVELCNEAEEVTILLCYINCDHEVSELYRAEPWFTQFR
jgi:myosin protein heavy chain